MLLSFVLLFLSKQFDVSAQALDIVKEAQIQLSAHNNTMNVKIEVVGDSLEVGTRPHWDAAKKCLYYVDVTTSFAYRYVPTTGRIFKAKIGDEPLAFMFPAEGAEDKFVAGLGRKLVSVTWDGVSLEPSKVETIREVDTSSDLGANRLNGGKVDPSGTLWAGTMGPQDSKDLKLSPKLGSLYSLRESELKKHLGDIGISNGLAWNYKEKKMYYIDTVDPCVYQFDFNQTSAELSNRTVIFEFEQHGVPGLPDGLTIDTEGKLWVACIHGSRIIKVDPETRELLQTIHFPVSQVTALTFGGPKLDVLYVNTAKMEVNGSVPAYPAGCTFSVHDTGARGLNDTAFKL